jgi:hypothetical protein
MPAFAGMTPEHVATAATFDHWPIRVIGCKMHQQKDASAEKGGIRS